MEYISKAPKPDEIDFAISYEEIDRVVKSVFKGAENLRKLDGHEPYMISKYTVERVFAEYSTIGSCKYDKDWYDCDDFALATLGLFRQPSLSMYVFGLMMSDTHAYNFFIDNSKVLWLFEPQTGKAFQFDGNEKYKAIQYLI